MAQTKNTGTKSESKEEKPKSIDQLLKEEVEARKEWYAHWGGGSPEKPLNQEQQASSRKHEKSKSALVAATGSTNYREAVKSLNHSPVYATRTAKK